MFCNYCGKNIQDDARVCAYCGRFVGAPTNPPRLMRSRYNRKIAGVAAGFANYTHSDVTLWRLIWVLAGIFLFPLGEIAYVIAWIVMPEEPAALPANGAVVTQSQ